MFCSQIRPQIFHVNIYISISSAASDRSVLTVKIMVDLRLRGPEPLIKLIGHLIRHEGSPTKRAGLLIVIHPTVQTRPVKNVLAIRQAPDLLAGLELVQADGAAFRRVSGDVPELDHGEEFSDQENRRGRVLGQLGPSFGPARVGL